MTTRAPQATPVLPDVYRLDCPFGEGGLVHVYYLAAPEPALIDTGVRASAGEVIAPALAAAGLRLDEVRYIFNTHGHWDLMGGNSAVRRLAPRARTCVHAADRRYLDDLSAHTEGYITYAARLTGDRQVLAQTQALVSRAIDCPTPVDLTVTDGQVFDLGGEWRLRAIHTPGHSLGSTSYLLEGAGALFTGDGVQGLGSRPGQLPLIFDDSRAYRATLVKLADLSFEAICLGHSFCGLGSVSGREPVRRGPAARQFLEESGEAAKAVEEAMRSVLNADPEAGFLAVARATLAVVAGPLGVDLDDQGLNVRSMATLHAFYRELTGAPPPS